jgi:K+-sensing histidine kinase KdpD
MTRLSGSGYYLDKQSAMFRQKAEEPRSESPQKNDFAKVLNTGGKRGQPSRGGIRMWILRRAEPVAVPLTLASFATAVLWLVRQMLGGEQHLVFFYLLPMALVAIIYGGRSAMICVAAASVCAAFFLYDPIYSFYVAEPADLGELICFTGLALIGAKCTADLLRPANNARNTRRRSPQV